MAGKVTPIKGIFPEQPEDSVATYDLNSTYAINQRRWNRDELVGKKGLLIYSRMLDDEQVKAVMNFKRDAITARGWQFKYRDDCPLSEDEQDGRKQLFAEAIKRMRGAFTDSLNMIMTGRAFGFSITEKVYSQIDIDGKAKIGINMLLGRDPCTFDFFTDEYGTLNRIEQNISGRAPVKVDIDRVIHYVHAPEWDHVFGRSDLREAYRAYYAKTQVQNLWLLWLERFAGGMAVASQTGEGNLTADQLQSVDDALKQLKSISSIRLPKGMELEVIMPATTDAYEKAVTFHDLAIAKAMLVPNLLGISHNSGAGSLAQSQTHLEAFYWTLNADAARLEACLNEQLFRDLGDQNWGDGEYPEFCFKPASWEHVKWVVETWKAMLGAGAVIATEEDEAFLRRMLEMPPRDDKAVPLVDPIEEQRHKDEMGLQKQALDAKAQQQQQPANDARYAATAEVLALVERVKQLETAEIGLRLRHDDGNSIKAALSKASVRVHFSVIAERTDASAQRVVPALSATIAKAVKRALGPDGQVGVMIDSDPQDIAAFQLNGADVGKIKRQLLETLADGWDFGQRLAMNEIDRAKGEKRDATETKVHAKSLRDNAAEYFDAGSFRMAANASDLARAIIQGELQTAVKYGKTVKETRTNIWDRLVARGLLDRGAVMAVETDDNVIAALNTLWADDEVQAAHYLDTLVRTNTFEAMNEARFAEFTDPELDDFVVALRYAAVLDSSTTEICTALNEATFKAESELWDTYRPPNHYNCRSVLVPITVIDGWDGVESSEPSVEPQEGFK